MGVDGDGLDELMVPNVRTIDYCGGDKSVLLASGDPAVFCSIRRRASLRRT